MFTKLTEKLAKETVNGSASIHNSYVGLQLMIYIRDYMTARAIPQKTDREKQRILSYKKTKGSKWSNIK